MYIELLVTAPVLYLLGFNLSWGLRRVPAWYEEGGYFSILASGLTEAGAGQLQAGFEKFFDVTTPTSTMNQITLVDTTTTNSDMRGTDNAALASVVGALADAAAAGDPTSADTIMQYIKQLVNVLVGTAGVGTWPTAKAPANAVNIAEVLRGIVEHGGYANP